MRSQGNSSLVLIISTLLLSVIGILSFQLYKLSKVGVSAPENNGQKTMCMEDRYTNNPADFLETYTVMPGDSLLTIAGDKLGNVSRVGELITLNNGTYPDLSIEKPFIEVGWKLYLPPNSTDSTSGHLNQVAGWISNIRQTSPNQIFEVSSNNAKNYYATVTLSEQTRLPDGYVPTVGDCVKVVEDEQNGTAYTLTLQ